MDPFEDFEKKNVGFEDELMDWAKQTAMKANTYLIVNRYQKSRTSDRRPSAARLTEEQLQQIERFMKSHLPPRNILQFFHEQDVGLHKIYNIVAKIKKNRMQGRNTVEEVLCLSAKRGYTVFYRNREESNVLSDIVVVHPTSIAMIRTWPCVLIMDTTYKTNK
ncbi:hypothetical protein M9H77_18617 [Catharanthus roseus]|uniref:Uncharacterized protein n=1 Tax=Catharanthus roseus TaxID=4058 RepID=A0ACC0B7X8_CATRO|nr:hypothetical protein M9H77_18617 [Catharanthus roseus]